MVSQREGEPDWGHHWSYLESVTRGWRPPKQPDDQRVTHVCRVKLAARRSLLKLSLHWPSRLGSERLESGFQSVFLMMKVTFFFFFAPHLRSTPSFPVLLSASPIFTPLSASSAFGFSVWPKIEASEDSFWSVSYCWHWLPADCNSCSISMHSDRHKPLQIRLRSVCKHLYVCVCVGVAFALFKWILPDSWYDWWQYKRWRWRGGGVYAKSCESAHMHLFPHSYSQSCRWAVPLGL